MKFGDRVVKGWEMSAAGYTGVWATGNTRAELWDAMKRRETYATSGPHMIVRFFGGYDFTEADISRIARRGRLREGCADGRRFEDRAGWQGADVPGGGAQGPISGNLDRIQIIKGWLDKTGKPQEKIYDVVWGDATRRRRIARREADAGGQHGRCRHGFVDQHHRRSRADRGVEGPGLRSRRSRVLLRARARDPDAAVDGVRRGVLQAQDRRSEGADDHPGARLHVADLVHAVIGRVLREPLLHFAVLGAALFVAYGMVRPSSADSDTIVVTAGQVASLEAQFASAWQRPPTDQERRAIVEGHVRDEVLVREGLALGLTATIRSSAIA